MVNSTFVEILSSVMKGFWFGSLHFVTDMYITFIWCEEVAVLGVCTVSDHHEVLEKDRCLCGSFFRLPVKFDSHGKTEQHVNSLVSL